MNKTAHRTKQICSLLPARRWPHTAEEHRVSLAFGAQQLPTLALFERGKLVKRLSNPTGSVLKGGLTANDCLKHFQLQRF